MKLVSRKEWGARAPRDSTRLSSAKGVKVHYTGDFEDPRALGDHTRCAPRVRSIQNDHMDGNGWADIGYNFLVCDHAYVFEGRGLRVLCAANGPGLNSGHFAVCGLVGNSGVTVPTTDMLTGIRDAIDHLRANGAGQEIKGHRDGYATDCPGEPLYAWVRAGAPRPAEDEEPAGLLADGSGVITPISLPRGRYGSVGFLADNGLQGLPAAKLRVAMCKAGGHWQVAEVSVDGAKGALVMPLPGATEGLSVRRLDAGNVKVAWSVA